MKNSLIALFLPLFVVSSYAQKYKIESLTVADGLSQGLVNSMVQDRRGFMWFGTLDGLNRYDGYQIKRYMPSVKPWGLKANSIFCIVEDANGLLWLGTDKGLVVMDPYTERFVQVSSTYRASTGSDVGDITIKAGGRIWFYYRQKAESSVYVLQPPTDLMRLIREGRVQDSDFCVKPVATGLSDVFVWLYTISDTVIAAIDWQSNLFYRINAQTLQIQKTDPQTLDYRRAGDYGLVRMQNGTRGFAFPLRKGETPGSSQVTGFLRLPGEAPLLYIGYGRTIYQLDTILPSPQNIGGEYRNDFPHLKPFFELDKTLSYTSLIDRVGNVWISTSGYGLRKISRRKLDFHQYLAVQSIINFTMLPDGRIWPGQYEPQRVINLHTDQLEALPAHLIPLIRKGIIMCNVVISRSGDWWMLAKRDNHLLLLKKNRLSPQWQEIPLDLKFKPYQLAMLEDQRGNIWIAGFDGQLIRVRPHTNAVDHWEMDTYFPPLLAHDLRSTSISEDAEGTLWIGQNAGLVQVAHPDGKPVFRAWHNYTEKGPLFQSDFILSVYADAKRPGIVWLGMRGGGLACFDSRTGTAETYTEADGLVNNVVYGILPDTFGYLWLSTNRGLCRFNPRNQTFRTFSDQEAKLGTEFNTGSYGLLPTGELAFGSIEGLFVIRPLAEKQEVQPCMVAITQLSINGKVLDPAIADAIWTFTTRNEISLQLSFDCNNLSFEFAALQTDDPLSAQYRYRVLGMGEQQWIYTGHQHALNLVAMPPGNYTIELQSIGSNDYWANAGTTRMYVEISPPWYRSWPAWWLYAGLMVLLLYIYVRYELRRVRLKYEVGLSRREMERLKSLDDFKNRFFGYISHEFKTPLTVIMGQAKRLPREQNQSATAIMQQSQSMLEMVDQMVDITRLDNQKLELDWRNGNFSKYVHYLVESLRSLAEFKGIRLDFQTTVPELMMDFDPLRLRYIVNNLLANAVRHTPPGGSIHISIYPEGPDQICFRVADTGEGIAAEDLPNIFDRYYRGGNANDPQPHHFGLGLAFIKDLLQLFAGKIDVTSLPGQGSVFTITLPVTQHAPPLEFSLSHPTLPPLKASAATSGHLSGKTLPLLLVVEDNPFITNFLQSALMPHFQVNCAIDGQEGYQKALQLVPDLIVTDVMMPGMDGYELTSRLKKHELTAHIPIVMLSARTDLSNRLTGQQLGADVYLGKPFDEQEMILILKNLYRLQHYWRDRYAGLVSHTISVGDLQKATADQLDQTVLQTDAFMLKIYSLFEKNYANDEYDLPQLSHDLKMSKSQLRRKLAALSDQSPMQLLRRYRLQKAYELLLENPDANVREICFQVGFKDPSHFSRLFSKTFQMAPSNVGKAT